MNDFKGRHFGGEVVLWAVRGFKTLETAYGTIKGFEVMRALRKGQARIFALQGGVVGEARIVERAFGLGPCPLTEAIVWLQGHLASAETRDEPLSLPGHPLATLASSAGLQQSPSVDVPRRFRYMTFAKRTGPTCATRG